MCWKTGDKIALSPKNTDGSVRILSFLEVAPSDELKFVDEAGNVFCLNEEEAEKAFEATMLAAVIVGLGDKWEEQILDTVDLLKTDEKMRRILELNLSDHAINNVPGDLK